MRRFPKEQEYWHRLICDLQAKLTMAEIAERVHANDQSLWCWKRGRSRPAGVVAIRLYLLHVKLYTDVSITPFHVSSKGERIIS